MHCNSAEIPLMGHSGICWSERKTPEIHQKRLFIGAGVLLLKAGKHIAIFPATTTPIRAWHSGQGAI
jgi:hypothetical protein